MRKQRSTVDPPDSPNEATTSHKQTLLTTKRKMAPLSMSSSTPPPEIGVGASDSILIAVSGVGFCFLAWTVYYYIIPKLKTAHDLRVDVDENGNEITYDEKLARTDVSTLNRAERRARARYIMKQQRKAAQPDGGNGDEFAVDGQAANGGGGVNDDIAILQQNENEPQVQDIPQIANNNHPNLRHLSRKERAERAKQKEREERRALETVRRREQQKVEDELHQRKKEKERQRTIQAEKDRQKRMQQREEDELTAYHQWRTFLPNPQSRSGGSSGSDDVLSVHEWISELNTDSKKTKIVPISALSKRFGVPPDYVRSRIHELLLIGRITGILEDNLAGSIATGTMSAEERLDDGYFIYVPLEHLSALASSLQKEDTITRKDVQRMISEHLFTSHAPDPLRK